MGVSGGLADGPAAGSAEAFDEARGRYQGLRAGQTVRVLADAQSLLVKPDIAAAQIATDEQQSQAAAAAGGSNSSNGGAGTTITATSTLPGSGTPGLRGGATVTRPVELRRFHGSVTIDPLRLGRDASQIAEEVVQHLTRIVGAQVEITLEIQANLPDPAHDKLVRDVTENCRTLRFGTYGFEEA